MFNYFGSFWYGQVEDVKDKTQTGEKLPSEAIAEVNVKYDDNFFSQSSLQESFEDRAMSSICIESIQAASPEAYLQEALQRNRCLERECEFLYANVTLLQQVLLHNGIRSGGLTQTCSECEEKFTTNHKFACARHPGELLPVTFKDLPEYVIKAHEPKSIHERAPERYWRWSCCGENDTAEPCCFDRHMPIDTSNLENSTISMVRKLEERSPGSKAFFHPTDSMVFYD